MLSYKRLSSKIINKLKTESLDVAKGFTARKNCIDVVYSITILEIATLCTFAGKIKIGRFNTADKRKVEIFQTCTTNYIKMVGDLFVSIRQKYCFIFSI